jgi:hypothetical protein
MAAMYTRPETRRRVTAPHTFSTKGEATRWLSATEADLFRGDAVRPDGPSERFGPYPEAWLAGKKNLRPLTQELYAYLLRVQLQPEFGDLPLGRITTSSVACAVGG